MTLRKPASGEIDGSRLANLSAIDPDEIVLVYSPVWRRRCLSAGFYGLRKQRTYASRRSLDIQLIGQVRMN